MKIELSDLEKNTHENIKIGSLKNFRENQHDLDKTDSRNRLNELTLEEWIKKTNSFHIFNKKVPIDSFKIQHPATFEEELPFYYIHFLSKKNDIIFDPFIGTGTTSIASNLLKRRSIGIEINKNFIDLARRRFKINGLNLKHHLILEGDCYSLLKKGEISSLMENIGEKIAFTVTSPPYYNILKSYSNMKDSNSPLYTNYGDDSKNLENKLDYNQFLEALTEIFKEIYHLMNNRSYLLINVKNYYKKVLYKDGNKNQEIQFFAWDLAKSISMTKWIPCCEQIWAYPNKFLFPFGYPFLYLANITHSYNLIFYKNTFKK